jgi:hypothetical protein
MFAQSAPANPPASGDTPAPAKTATTKVKKHKKAHKAVKKAAPKTDAGTSK